tara:strand:- start:443 stop:727 length:285 start_codon:yes stop_codon:yes gene_type:complete
MDSHLLSPEEIQSMVKKLAGWQLADKKLTRTIKFPNFIEAFSFMTKVAFIAERLNHHPDWSNSYSQVKIELTSHDLGGISTLDIELASIIDSMI